MPKRRQSRTWRITVDLVADDGERATEVVVVISDAEPPPITQEIIVNGRAFRPVYQQAIRQSTRASRRRRRP